jgi:hypothetical protein
MYTLAKIRRAAPRVFAAAEANAEGSSILSDSLSQDLANEVSEARIKSFYSFTCVTI